MDRNWQRLTNHLHNSEPITSQEDWPVRSITESSTCSTINWRTAFTFFWRLKRWLQTAIFLKTTLTRNITLEYYWYSWVQSIRLIYTPSYFILTMPIGVQCHLLQDTSQNFLTLFTVTELITVICYIIIWYYYFNVFFHLRLFWHSMQADLVLVYLSWARVLHIIPVYVWSTSHMRCLPLIQDR